MIERINLKSGILSYNSYAINEKKPFNEQRLELNEDLIQICFKHNFTVDVGWYPLLNPKGHFRIVLIYKYEWLYPIYKKICKKIDVLAHRLQEVIDIADKLSKTKDYYTKLAILTQCDRYYPTEKYTLFIFKKTGIPLSLLTIFVGRKLDILYSEEVKEFLLAFYTKNPKFNFLENIKQLKRISKEEIIDNILIQIMHKLNMSLIDECSKEWKLECLKWRYCILNDIKKYVKDNLILWTKVYDVYTAFNLPQDMEYLIKPMDHADLLEKEFNKLRGKLNAFLKKEKLYIKNEQHYSKN